MITPHNCDTDDRKLPIDRPCSPCSSGDTEMEHHDHCPPFREGTALKCNCDPKYRHICWKCGGTGYLKQ